MLRGKDIVCISSLDWSAMWTSKHQIMHRLAQANRVLYVEEPVTMLAPFRTPARLRRWTAVAPQLTQVDAGLWTLTPPPLLPFWNMKPGVNRVNQGVLARYLRWAMDRLYFDEEYIFWTYLPAALALLDRLGGREAPSTGTPPASDPATEQGRKTRSAAHRRASLVIYHCADEYSAFPGFVSPAVVKHYDYELTRRADLVITTSENLRRARESLNPHIHTVFNAADVEIFNRALDPDLPLPEDLSVIPAPRLGVVGLHDSRLDQEALEVLAKADPGWHIVLIGPVKPGQVDEARLRRQPNIHFLGEKPRAALPAYLKGMAVALVPYRTNELTRNIFPLKLFEYLAAGLPVVVGGLPELRRFAGTIGVADGPQDYPGLVRSAIAEDGLEKRAARVAQAAENTWDHRVEEISGLVEQALVRSGRTAET
jgi:glycosyltransferase involved in cell wall biosynthesis